MQDEYDVTQFVTDLSDNDEDFDNYLDNFKGNLL